jgi:hypothetical protein
VACTMEAWRRYFWYCYVSGMGTTVGEWFLSFGVVAMRPVIPGPVVVMACSSLPFDWRRRPRPRRRESWSDLIPIVGIVAQGGCSVHCARMNRAYSASMSGIVVSSSPPCLLQAMAW